MHYYTSLLLSRVVQSLSTVVPYITVSLPHLSRSLEFYCPFSCQISCASSHNVETVAVLWYNKLASRRMGGNKRYTGFKIVFWVTQAVGITALVLLFVWIFCFRGGVAWNSDLKLQFNWHALCLPFGSVYLSANEILVFRALRFGQKRMLKLLHAGHSIAIIFLLVVGYWAILDCHNYQGKPNWYSLHAWMGIVSTVLYVSQVLFGCATFLWPGATVEIRVMYKPFHIFIGLTTFIMSTATTLMGLFEVIAHIDGYKQFSGEGTMMNLCGMFFAVFAILVSYILTNPGYQRKPLESD